MCFRCIEQPLGQGEELLIRCTVQLQYSCSLKSQIASVGEIKTSHSAIGNSLLVRASCWESRISWVWTGKWIHFLGAFSNNLNASYEGYEFLGLRLKPPRFCCLVQYPTFCGFHPDIPTYYSTPSTKSPYAYPIRLLENTYILKGLLSTFIIRDFSGSKVLKRLQKCGLNT